MSVLSGSFRFAALLGCRGDGGECRLFDGRRLANKGDDGKVGDTFDDGLHTCLYFNVRKL